MVSKMADLWLLGRNRLSYGSVLETGALGRRWVRTAPPWAHRLPYHVPIDGPASGLGAIHHRPFSMAPGEMNQAEFAAFLD
jgi:hypothetical protein